MKKVILVTGGAGYIGSHTSVELIEAGYDVVIVDNLVNSTPAAVEGIRKITGIDVPFEQVDCTDRAAFGAVFKKYKIDGVIHFAALKAVGESVHEPLKYYDNNINSILILIALMRENGVRNIVFSSSCTVYGQAEVLPVTEQTPRAEPLSPYGNTKRVCEDILKDSVRAYGDIKSIALRYFNPIGAHESGLIGELPVGAPNNLVPFITQTAAGVRDELKIFGNDYDTPDGTPLRDYIDVVDLSKAHVKAIDRILGESESYEVFNIGTGIPLSVLELVNTFEQATGVKVKYQIVGRREGDITAVWGDNSRANKILGWKAGRPLDQTLASSWVWEKNVRGLK